MQVSEQFFQSFLCSRVKQGQTGNGVPFVIFKRGQWSLADIVYFNRKLL
jgi:hypothetical protein